MSDSQSSGGVSWLAAGMAYVFRNVRPPLHVAVYVLYWSFFSTLLAWLTVLIHMLFGESRTVDYELLGFFAGPIGVGSLGSALYDGLYGDEANPWIATGIFGGVSGYVFWVVVEMKHRDTIDFDTGVLVAIGVACLFLLMRWLQLKGSQSNAA